MVFCVDFVSSLYQEIRYPIFQLFLYLLLIHKWCLRDLVPFVQFKKREKHPWRSVTFSNFTESNTPPWVFFFSRFLNCTNGNKSR